MGSKSDEVKGHAKEVVGTLTGDDDLKTEGKADRVAGEVKEKISDATAKVEDVIDKAKDALHRK
jgi:uncharacterized protein YjbJ (UPF0337 family)